MDLDSYMVLRVSEAEQNAYDALRGYTWRSGPRAGSPPEVSYQVETVTATPREAQEIQRDPEVRVMAAPMPLRLIGPVPLATGDEDAGGETTDEGATWGVQVTGALHSPYLGRGVTVAVLDTGIDADHEAFEGVELIQRDWTGEGNGDEHGHGTHVAGTIFGRTAQGTRYAVAPGVSRALIGKVIGQESGASTKELVEAIQWAVDGGAQIINMSLGFDFPGLVKWWIDRGVEVDLATSRALVRYRDNVRFFDRLVELLRARAAEFEGALIVAAAGNESRRGVRPDYTVDVSPPAAAQGIISVAALRTAGPPHDTLAVAPFSNIGALVSGPGMGVYSAHAGGGYHYLNGTSMASPHVAGVAALWAERQLERSGSVNASTLEAQLRGNTRFDSLGEAPRLDVGDGLVAAPAG